MSSRFAQELFPAQLTESIERWIVTRRRRFEVRARPLPKPPSIDKKMVKLPWREAHGSPVRRPHPRNRLPSAESSSARRAGADLADRNSDFRSSVLADVAVAHHWHDSAIATDL